MKYRHLLLIALLMHCALCTMASSMDNDPLQPVWNSLEKLPSKIMAEVQLQMDIVTGDINRMIDQEIENWKSDLKNGSSMPKPRSTEETDETKRLLIEGLTGSFEHFYNTQMKTENEAVLFYNDNTALEILQEVEIKVITHLDRILQKADLFFEFNHTIEDLVFELADHASSLSFDVTTINGNVNNIRETLLPEKLDVCLATEQDLQQFIDEKMPSQQRIADFEREFEATYQAVAKDLPSVYFHRDCSDILAANPNATTGVYTILPSRDPQRKQNVWCDMETDVEEKGQKGGWTVMLRRRESAVLLNFNRTWEEYSAGFGEPSDVGEWWLGLTWVHQLTYHQPYQLLIKIRDVEKGHFNAHYTIFRVEDQLKNFRLVVDGFSGNVSDAFKTQHHGQPFSTYDRDNERCETCNCATNNGGGWWYNKCHRTVLTAIFPSSNDRGAKTIRWLNGNWLVLNDVIMMIKPSD